MAEPKLRFKRPDGTEFENRKLIPFSELYSLVKEKNNGKFGIDNIISVANMYFKKDANISSDDYLSTYNICRLGDIAFEGNKSKSFANGRLVENTIGDGIVSHVFIVFRPNSSEHNLDYWKYAINNENVMGRILARCTKKSTMMTDLVPDDFLKLKTNVPCAEEQKKIADFLVGLDDLLQYIEEDIILWEEKKKGIMQKIFSQEIRFKRDDGSNFPKWEMKRLGDYITVFSDRTSDKEQYPLYSLTIEDGLIPKSERYEREHLVTKEGDVYKIVPPNAFVYNPMNLRFGAVKPNHSGKFVSVSGYYDVFKIGTDETIAFWENYLVSFYMINWYNAIATGSLIEKKRVHFSQFVDIEKKLPCLEEQKKISECLSAIDQVIRIKKQKLETWQNIKKGLLQQMFV